MPQGASDALRGSLLGDMLMELRRPGDALVEYRAALLKAPNRYRTLHGTAEEEYRMLEDRA